MLRRFIFKWLGMDLQRSIVRDNSIVTSVVVGGTGGYYVTKRLTVLLEQLFLVYFSNDDWNSN